jgi:OPT oligopeptide transporter protein
MLLSLPICMAWARYMPNISFFGIPLNPGPFTIKEHVIITIMAEVGSNPAYAVSVAPTWQLCQGGSVLFELLQSPSDRCHRRSESLLQSTSPICL